VGLIAVDVIALFPQLKNQHFLKSSLTKNTMSFIAVARVGINKELVK
jgi:hypothetical protein